MRVTRRRGPASSTVTVSGGVIEDRTLVLGIDQSYSGFGLCVMGADGQGAATKTSFPASRSSGVDRLIEVEAWFAGALAAIGHERIAHVCMEDYARSMRNQREEMGELGAVVKMVLRRLGVPTGYPTIVSTSALKKFATGSGASTVKKQQILLAVYKKWGVEYRDDNQADAYVLAKIAHALYYGGEQLGYEREVTDKLRRHTEWVRA